MITSSFTIFIWLPIVSELSIKYSVSNSLFIEEGLNIQVVSLFISYLKFAKLNVSIQQSPFSTVLQEN